VIQFYYYIKDTGEKNMLSDDTLPLARVPGDSDGIPLVWVINGECLYDLPLSVANAEVFLTADEVVDVSSEYPEHTGITVRFLLNGTVLEELKTSEYFGSILLSNPQVLDLRLYAFGRYVQSPNATFDGTQFHITNRDVSQHYPWAPGYEPTL
jgi:hypothetical protein